VVHIQLTGYTSAIYGQTIGHDFVNYDDDIYVIQNKHIQNGFTLESILWTFEFYISNWHPLTWLSHMLDYQFFKLVPAGHHLTNCILHLINGMLLFLVLQKSTQAFWKSFLVAVLFIIHPINVESVAWVAQRKNTLSTFFWFLTIWAYIEYIGNQKTGKFLWVILFFALGIMSKGMLVTLPFTLLLLDFWPLKRLPINLENKEKIKKVWALVQEKWILFIMLLIGCLLTYKAQKSGGSIISYDLVLSIKNTLNSYISYIWKMLWPNKLSIFYPLVSIPLWKVWVTTFMLICFSYFAIRFLEKLPYLFFGWFWYLGTLVPVIGVVQIGSQAMADRYAYIPLVGLFIIFSWGIGSLVEKINIRPTWSIVWISGILLALSISSWLQVKHWKNTVTLFQNAEKTIPNNYLAHMKLGLEYLKEENINTGIQHLNKALQINPDIPEGHYGLGYALASLGKFDEAMRHLNLAIKIKPDLGEAYLSMGNVLAEIGKPKEAIQNYSKALGLRPNLEEAHNNLGEVLIKQNKFKEGKAHFIKAIMINPNFADAYNNLGVAHMTLKNLSEATKNYMQAILLKPDFGEAHFNLGNVKAVEENHEEALKHYFLSLKKLSNQVKVYHNIGLSYLRLGEVERAIEFFKSAIKLQPNFEPSNKILNEIGPN
jgi:protein O-mannosyl-transferase